jgi:hypothetical protein
MTAFLATASLSASPRLLAGDALPGLLPLPAGDQQRDAGDRERQPMPPGADTRRNGGLHA